eukprot:2135771-Pleurochrysis_carterae.AAC.1
MRAFAVCRRQRVRSRLPQGRSRHQKAENYANSAASVRTGMPAVYIALASLHYSQRVPHWSDNTLKGLAVALTRKGEVGTMGSGGKRAVCLLEDLRLCVNQRREAHIQPPLAVASAESCPTTASATSSEQQGEFRRPFGGKYTLPSDGGSKYQPPVPERVRKSKTFSIMFLLLGAAFWIRARGWGDDSQNFRHSASVTYSSIRH